MTTHAFDDLATSLGEPIDPDLVSFMKSKRCSTLESACERGRAYWIGVFAAQQGFERDFDGLLAELGLSWEEAASAERLQCSIWDFEIGVPASATLQDHGIEIFAQAFEKSRDFWQEALAQRSGLFQELEGLVQAHDFRW